MTILKQLHITSDNLPAKSERVVQAAGALQLMLSRNSKTLFEYTKKTLGVANPRAWGDYFSWAGNTPRRSGTSFQGRFDFWAGNAKFETIPFMTRSGCLVFPWYAEDDFVYVSDYTYSYLDRVSITELFPIFPSNLRAMLAEECADSAAEEYWGQYSLILAECKILNKHREHLHTKNYENLDDLDLDEEVQDWSWNCNTAPKTKTVLKETTNSIKEETPMTTTKSTIKSGMVNANKDALAAVAYLNAGRASNKLIKEACRPILNAMFKPTFMQKLGMKLFKMENPVDVALKSTMSDLICAQLVQAIIEIKGVEDQHVRTVAQSGITYAGLKVSELIPFEKAMDDVVAKISEGAAGIVGNLKKNK